jgi:RNA polymerase sigma-70 factor (ECF subfamily)
MSFDELYRDYSERVYGYCYRLCEGDGEEAQDVAQETFILAFRALDQFEGRSSVLTWLFQIARRVRTRRRERTPDTVPLELTAELPDSTGDPARGHVRKLWLETALSRLPAHLREALMLVKAEGLTYREAAEVLELPQGTVQFHVSQALKQMRTILGEELGVPAAFSVLVLLLLQRELRAAEPEPVPNGLAERVYAEIGRDCPADLARGVQHHGRRPASAVVRQQTTRRLAVGAAVTLLALLLAGRWRTVLPAPRPRTPLDPVLAEMARVPTVHATGTFTHLISDPSGTTDTEERRVECWYKLPGRYRIVAKGGPASHLVLETNGRATEVSIVYGRGVQSPVIRDYVSRMPIDQTRAQPLLAYFAFFNDNGLLVRELRSNRARVTQLSSELEAQDVDLFTVETRRGTVDHRWDLYADPESHRLIRADYRVADQKPRIKRGLTTITLERFEYEVAVPDRLFDPEHLDGALPDHTP